VFNLYRDDRIKIWREFRDALEVSNTPLQDVAEFWSLAPFVNPYLNTQNPSEWPDPWHLILEGKYDDLAITLGMLYTLKLTQRFMDTHCEIHMSMLPNEKDPKFFLIVDQSDVLNFEYKRSLKIHEIPQQDSNIIWKGRSLP
jgi:hypothetical protein